jgi:4-amino-4-deoxy-L-arabinose transferase-like glycosyltransferase
MQRDERLAADAPVERPAPRRGPAPAWLLPALPGALASLLFLALALGSPVLGAAATPAQLALGLALAASIVAQPRARERLTRLAAWPGLPHAATLAGVTLLAALLRFWGLRFGLPYLEHPDEWAVAEEAARMLQSGDYRPFSYTYPTLYIYMQVGVAAAHFLWGSGAGLYRDLPDLDPALYYPWMRALTATLGTAGVLLTYAVGRRLYGRAIGLVAAALLAVLPVAAGDAHYVTTDTPALFFTLLAFLAIARLGVAAEGRSATTHERRPASDAEPALGGPWSLVGRRGSLYAGALIAGLATGLAAATKYNVAVLVIPLALGVFLAARDERRSATDDRGQRPESRAAAGSPWSLVVVGLLWAALGALLGFTLGVPLWLRELPRLLDDLASIVVHYRFEGHPGAESSRPALFYWGALANEGLLLALVTLAGLLLAFVRRSRADLLVLAFVVPTVLQLTGVKVVFFRNAVPLLPFVCLLAAAALALLANAAYRWLRPGTRGEAVRADATGGLAGPRASSRSSAARLALDGPALLLVCATVLVATEPLATALHDELLRSRPTTRILATEWVERNAPDGARIWLEDGTLKLPARLRVQGGRPVTSNDLAWYRENGFRFLVANMDRDDKDRGRLAAFGEPAMRFERAGERHGPTLAVYDTGAGDVASEPRTPSGATLGGGALALEGYRHPGEVRAGEVLPLALYWRAARQLPADYTVFVHLLDDQGGKLAQRDLPPLEGSLPTSRWTPGELVRDDQDLPVPVSVPPGTYRLVAGMYDSQTFAPIVDAGPIELGVVTVTAP